MQIQTSDAEPHLPWTMAFTAQITPYSTSTTSIHPSASTILTTAGFFIAFPDLDVIATISNAEQGSEVATLIEDSIDIDRLAYGTIED